MNSKENWALEIDPNVRKDLARLPKKDAQTITDMIDGLVFNPFLGDLKKIKGEENMWRRRIGSYRIFYEIYPNQKIIHVIEVERRTFKTY